MQANSIVPAKDHMGDFPPEIASQLIQTAQVVQALAPIATWNKQAADGAAATATAETVIDTVGPSGPLVAGSPAAITLGACVFAPAAALVHNAANYATISVFKRTNGGAAVLIAQLATTANDWTAWTNVTIPLQAGATVAAGDVITFTITKAGTGVVVPQGQLALFAA